MSAAAPADASPASFPSSRAGAVHSVPQMIEQRTLAAQTIARFGTPDTIFDGDNLRRLRRFVYAPAGGERAAARESILRGEPEGGSGNGSGNGHGNGNGDAAGDGDGASGEGGEAEWNADIAARSLSGLAIARHGTARWVLSEGDIGALRWWFRELERAGASLDNE